MPLQFLKMMPESVLAVMQAANGLSSGPRRALRRIEHWFDVRRDRRILLSMNDQQLKDIGISRGEAERAIRTGR